MEYYGRSDKGSVRPENQDNFVFGKLGNLVVACVCDGMGGMKGGGVASKIACDTFFSGFSSLCSDFLASGPESSLPLLLPSFLKKSVSAADAAVKAKALENEELSDMGTTLVSCAVYEDTIYVVNVGDSRLYKYSDGEASALTIDHSYNRFLIDSGDPGGKLGVGKNILMRSLGASKCADPDSFTVPVDKGDILLLCSDGLYNSLGDELDKILLGSENESAEKISGYLIERALRLGADDNVTAAIIKI